MVGWYWNSKYAWLKWNYENDAMILFLGCSLGESSGQYSLWFLVMCIGSLYSISINSGTCILQSNKKYLMGDLLAVLTAAVWYAAHLLGTFFPEALI